MNVVSSYDGWLLVVKGWSVILSLAALGLGFQQGHYALFFLAAVTGAAFWYIDGLMKGFQDRYYVRMREMNTPPTGSTGFPSAACSARTRSPRRVST